MSDDRAFELVSAAADGALEAEQQLELDQLLEVSPAARRFQADLAGLEAVLSDLSPLELPPSLHRRIIARIPRFNTMQRRERVAVFAIPRTFRYGLAAAAAALLAIVIHESYPMLPESVNDREMAGTMAARGGDVEVLDSYRLRAQDREAGVQLLRSGGALLLDVRTHAGKPVDLAVDFAASGLLPDGPAQGDAPPGAVEVTGQVLHVHANDQRHVTVSLRRAPDAAFAEPARIDVELSSNGRVLQQGSLYLPGK